MALCVMVLLGILEGRALLNLRQPHGGTHALPINQGTMSAGVTTTTTEAGVGGCADVTKPRTGEMDRVDASLTDEALFAYIGYRSPGGYDPNDVPEDGFFFMQHLRKAGGTTLCAVLSQNVPANALADCFIHKTIGGKQKNQRSLEVGWDLATLEESMVAQSVKVASSEDGVFPSWIDFDDPTLLPILRHWSFVTALRFPLDRMTSFFMYEGSVVEWGDSRSKLCGSKNEFNQDPHRVTECLQQHQHMFWSTGVNQVNYYTRVFASNPDCPLTSEDLIKAVKVLNNFAVVLVTEWFQEDAVVLKYMFGMDNVLAVPRNARSTMKQSKWNDPDPSKNRVTAVPKEEKEQIRMHYSKHSHTKEVYDAADYSYFKQLHAFDLRLYKVAQEISRKRNSKWLRYDMTEEGGK